MIHSILGMCILAIGISVLKNGMLYYARQIWIGREKTVAELVSVVCGSSHGDSECLGLTRGTPSVLREAHLPAPLKMRIALEILLACMVLLEQLCVCTRYSLQFTPFGFVLFFPRTFES